MLSTIFGSSPVKIQNACFQCGKAGDIDQTNSSSTEASEKKMLLEETVEKTHLHFCQVCNNATYCSSKCETDAKSEHQIYCMTDKPFELEKIRKTMANMVEQGKIEKEDLAKNFYVFWIRTDDNGLHETEDKRYVLANKTIPTKRTDTLAQGVPSSIRNLMLQNGDICVVEVDCINPTNFKYFDDNKYKGIYVFSI